MEQTAQNIHLLRKSVTALCVPECGQTPVELHRQIHVDDAERQDLIRTLDNANSGVPGPDRLGVAIFRHLSFVHQLEATHVGSGVHFTEKNSAEDDGLGRAVPQGSGKVVAEVDTVAEGRSFFTVDGSGIGPEVFGEDETNVARVGPVKEKYFI